MKRLLLILAAIVATGGIAATPAVGGLPPAPPRPHAAGHDHRDR